MTGWQNKPFQVQAKEGETIQAIEVICPCGNEILLDCVYDGPTDQSGPEPTPPSDNGGAAPETVPTEE